ncbi:MAG TPA: hypothetical protein PKC79_20970 [Solidesulfovibrio magneticus]|nr:hypothetical protein [Solidesulfovibrio magneticus]
MARITPQKEVWRDIPNDPDKGQLKIRHLKQGEINDIEDSIERYETMLRPDAAGVVHQEVRVNPAKGDKRYAYICAAVRDWKNVYGLDGKPMECTDANKILLARDDEDFGKVVGQFRRELAEQVAQEKEAARKNATTSAAGSPA